MNLFLSDKFEYVPEWNGNKELPKAEQVVFVLKHLGTNDTVRLPKSGVDKDGKIVDADIFADYLRARWLLVCVEIKNITNNKNP